MVVFKCLYKRQNDSTEYDLTALATTPDDIQRYLYQLYGELPYFRVYGRTEVQLILPEVEHRIYKKVKRDIEQ